MTDIQAIAQQELDQYIEEQGKEIAPEPKIDFIDIDFFYTFEALVNGTLITTIRLNSSEKSSYWVVEVNGVEIHRSYLYSEATDFIKAAYTNATLHLLPQTAVEAITLQA